VSLCVWAPYAILTCTNSDHHCFPGVTCQSLGVKGKFSLEPDKAKRLSTEMECCIQKKILVVHNTCYVLWAALFNGSHNHDAPPLLIHLGWLSKDNDDYHRWLGFNVTIGFLLAKPI
jgi:hypothetical protein